MAVQLNVNSYVTVADADLFFGNRLDVAAWQGADSTTKGQALMTATQMLDDMLWAGTVVNSDQPLAFPRVCEYFDPKLGTLVYLDGASVPERIIRATLELAYHLLNNDGLLDSSDTVKSIAIGPIKLDGMQPVSVVPIAVKNVIKPLLINAGTSTWWRAN